MSRNKSPLFYGWVVVAICFITVAVSYGIRYSFSVFYVTILQHFGWTRADTALIFSLNIIVYGICAPIVGAGIDRFGPQKLMSAGAFVLAIATALCSLANQIWHFYLFFGVLASLGICATGYVTNTVLVSRWFIKRRGTALGIYMVGFGVAYVLASGVEYLIGQIGWQNSFIILGILALVITPIIAIFQRLDPKDLGLLPDGETQVSHDSEGKTNTNKVLYAGSEWRKQEWNLRKAIKTRQFWFLFLGNFFMWGIAVNLILAHQVAFATDEGYSLSFGALIFSLYGIFYGTGNLFGFISDRLGREVTVSIGLSTAVLGVLMLILNNTSITPWLMYAYSLLFGLGIGVTSPAFTASAADIFQGKFFGSINGLIVAAFGIGGFISPWLGGKIFDVLGTYIPALYIVIGALITSAICVWLAAPRKIVLLTKESRFNSSKL